MTYSPLGGSLSSAGYRKRVSSIAVNPPRPRMPPLNALKAFEAAARQESFAKAATELGVTPAAVSHQVKALEEWLGSALFVRQAQGLHLTEIGKSAMPAFSKAFDMMGLAVQELRATAPRVQVTVAALPSVAQLWLTPRLPALRTAFPNLRTSIFALEEPPNFRREPFDLALFYMRGKARGSRSYKLCEDRIFPVCKPEIATALRGPSDLAVQSLLWDASWADDWPRWFKAADIADVSVDEGSAFSLFSLALQAALDGAGVLIGHEALVSSYLLSGALVAPFDLAVETGMELQLLTPERPSAKIAQLVEWLTSPF